MVELFADLPQEVKIQIQKFIDSAFNYFDIKDAVNIIANFANSCFNEEEQDFIDFYFNLKMEQFNNEDTNDLSEEPAW